MSSRSEILSTASCTLPLRLDDSAGPLCGIPHVACVPSQLHQLNQASARIQSVEFRRRAESSERPLFILDSNPMRHLARPVDIARHLASFGKAHLRSRARRPRFTSTDLLRLLRVRELDMTVYDCNPSHAALLASLHGLETLHLTDCNFGDMAGEYSDYWGDVDSYPTFATSLWAAVGDLPRLAELHLHTAHDESLLDVLAGYLNAPEGPFLSVKRVYLNEEYSNIYSVSPVDESQAGRFVRQFPRLEELAIFGCGDWPDGVGVDHPWPQLKNLEIFIYSHRTNSSITLSWEGIRGMAQLQTLVIKSPYQVTSMPEWIGELTQLTTLHMEADEIASLPQSLTKLQHLTSLDLCFLDCSQLPDDIGRMTALAELNLIVCGSLTTLPPSIAELTVKWSQDHFGTKGPSQRLLGKVQEDYSTSMWRISFPTIEQPMRCRSLKYFP